MTKDERCEYFFRSFNDRHQRFQDSLNIFMTSLVGNNQKEKTSTSADCLKQLDILMSFLSPSDRPNWNENLRSKLHNVALQEGNTNYFKDISADLFSAYHEARSQDWKFLRNDQDDGSFKLDDVYRKHYEASAIPKLFDKLVDTLHEMISNNWVDSAIAREAIAKLAAVIKNNSHGSYVAANQSRVFLNQFVKSAAWHIVKDTPILGSLAKAVEDVTKEINLDWYKTFDDIRTKIKEEIDAEIPQFDPARLPAPLAKAIKDQSIAENVTDVEFYNPEPPQLDPPKGDTAA